MSSFSYRPLNGEKPIRLLCIQPGTGSDPVSCSLIHTSLLSYPTYEALSYTWGSPERPEKIYCGGKEIFVRRNLFAALSTFRQKAKPRTIWIDALCINQDDSNEKTKQIMLMAEIYKQADRGLIWLGEKSDKDRLAFRTLHLLDSFFDWYEGVAANDSSLRKEPSLARDLFVVESKIREFDISKEMWACLNRFFQRPWFRRVWVIQEIVFVAQSRLPTLVLCGNANLSWEELARVAKGITSLGFHFQYGDGNLQDLGYMAIQLMENLRNVSTDHPSRRPLTMLQFTRESGATDPRDRIFALYGLLSHDEANDRLLLPDYSKDVQDVYINVAIHSLRSTNTLCLLQSLPWTLPQNGGFGGISSLPSWVPDWSRRHAVPSLPRTTFHAGGREPSEFRVYDTENLLAIKGRIFDYVGALMQPDKIVLARGNETVEDWLSSFKAIHHFKREWYKSCLFACCNITGQRANEEFPIPSVHDRYPTGESLQEAFWRTLICNMDMQYQKAGPEYRDHWLHVHHLYSSSADIKSYKGQMESILRMKAFEEPMALFAEGRRFCVTAKGYMGWVPQVARPGDLFCIFKGVEVPFLLRKALFTARDLPLMIRPGAVYYQIIGECYVHGVMDGQLAEKNVQWTDVILS
jgi:Heterokaryon incompatibility protein (HET)